MVHPECPSAPVCHQCHHTSALRSNASLINSSTTSKRRTQLEQLCDFPYVTYFCGWNIQGSNRSNPSCVKCGPRCRARRWPPLAARACNPLLEMLWTVGASSSCSWQIRDDSSPVPTHQSLCCSSSRGGKAASKQQPITTRDPPTKASPVAEETHSDTTTQLQRGGGETWLDRFPHPDARGRISSASDTQQIRILAD